MIRSLRCLLVVVFAFVGHAAISQDYFFNTTFTDGQTISTCSGTFLDDGHANDQYARGLHYSVTLCPSTAGKRMKLDFSVMDIAAGDTLVIYDGPNTSAPVLATFNSSNITLGSIVAQNNGGCLTVRFRSDNIAQGLGWIAAIKCAQPCQSILGNITSIPAADANGVVNVCVGQAVTLTANITYPDNGTHYTQSNALSNFTWRPGFANDTSGNNVTSITKVITQAAGYKAKLTVTDTNGCKNAQEILLRVRTSIQPSFNITGNTSICLGDTAVLTGNPNPNEGYYIQPPFSGDSLALPDVPAGQVVSYTDTLRITDFNPGQTLTNINDFLGVFVNMEHTYLGDLELLIKAPNGTSVILKQYGGVGGGGGGTYLGEPVLGDDPSQSGRGYEYGFTPTATLGTMVQASATAPITNYISTVGIPVNNRRILPAGDYNPSASLNALIGTPLNGNWIIKITDNLQQDNGFLFNWKIKFKPSLYPNPEPFNVPIQGAQWNPGTGVISNIAGTITASPLATGSFPYTFRVTDAASCTFDTVVNVTVKAIPGKPDVGADRTICANQTLILSVNNYSAANTYQWNTGATTNSINITQPGLYWVRARNAGGCYNADTILVSPPPNLAINLGDDTLYCASNANVLQPELTGTFNSFLWSNGSTGASLTTNGPGIYWVQGTAANGCAVRDSITLTHNPVNNWQMPNDTIVCGNSYTINITNNPANTSYTWWDGVTGLNHVITDSGSYAATANHAGCLKTDDVVIAINRNPVVSLGNDTLFCASQPNILQSKVTGAPAVTYLWNNNSTNNNLPITATGTYWLEVRTPVGCKARDSIIVDVNPINNWQMPADTSICDLSTKDIQLSGYPATTTFTWYDGSTADYHMVSAAGKYGVTANYIGCLKQDDIDISIRPLPVISVGPDTAICQSFTWPVKVNYPLASYTWSTGSTDTGIVIDKAGTYWVQALLNGCSYRDTMTFAYLDCNCNTRVPNAFSPNGDNINDVLKVKIECYPFRYKFSIFNRYGQPVFTADDFNKGWDGTRNGNPLPVGTYYYILNYYNEGLKKNEQFTGSITLLR